MLPYRNHDMLPLGYQKKPNRANYSNPNGLSADEQRTLMSLWGITRSPLIYGGRLDNITNETVGLLTNKHVLLLSQNATKPPRPITGPRAISAGLGSAYQGLGYTVATCNSSDARQRWTASKIEVAGVGLGSRVGGGGGGGGAVNLHKTYEKNGTAQQVRPGYHGIS